VVADGPRFLVDVDGSGTLPVTFDATPSHTHDPDRRIKAYKWTDLTGTASLGTAAVATALLGPGAYDWNLTIFDDAASPSSKSDIVHFDIYAPTQVPGAYATFFLGLTDADLAATLAAVVPSAAARLPGFWLASPLPGRVTGVPVLVRMVANYTVPAGE
jgi:hypothetical protein